MAALPSSSEKVGLDKEIHDRILAKYDVQREAEAMQWIGDVVGIPSPQVLGEEGAALYTWLKDGVVLCDLLNALRPGTVPSSKVCRKPKHVLEERGNIEAYLAGCVQLQLPSQDLFILSDLHSAKALPAVLQNIFALGRQAQVLEGFSGPRLGVKYSVTLEEQTARKERKQEEAERQRELERKESERQLNRRRELEQAKRQESIDDMEDVERRALERKLEKGRLSRKAFAQAKQASELHFKAIREMPEEELEIAIEPVKYGMDIEIEKKMKAKRNTKEEESAMDWIEKVTGREVNNFHEHLKSGKVLCELINALRPDTIRRLNTKNSPIAHRDNIQLYLTACGRLGVPRGNLFNINDLYEKADLQAVVGNIFALSRAASVLPTWRGPLLNQDGTLLLKRREKAGRGCCVIS